MAAQTEETITKLHFKIVRFVFLSRLVSDIVYRFDKGVISESASGYSYNKITSVPINPSLLNDFERRERHTEEKSCTSTLRYLFQKVAATWSSS